MTAAINIHPIFNPMYFGPAARLDSMGAGDVPTFSWGQAIFNAESSHFDGALALSGAFATTWGEVNRSGDNSHSDGGFDSAWAERGAEGFDDTPAITLIGSPLEVQGGSWCPIL